MVVSMWEHPDLWPADPAGYVFIGRAVCEVGLAMCGNQWIGDEPLAQLIQPKLGIVPEAPGLPERIGSAEEYVIAARFVKRWAPDLAASPPRPAGAFLPPQFPDHPEMTSETWDMIRGAIDERAHAVRKKSPVDQDHNPAPSAIPAVANSLATLRLRSRSPGEEPASSSAARQDSILIESDVLRGPSGQLLTGREEIRNPRRCHRPRFQVRGGARRPCG